MPQIRFTLFDYKIIKNSVINTNTNKPYSYETYRRVIAGIRQNEIISKAVDYYFNVIVPKEQEELKKFVIEFTNKKQI